MVRGGGGSARGSAQGQGLGPSSHRKGGGAATSARGGTGGSGGRSTGKGSRVSGLSDYEDDNHHRGGSNHHHHRHNNDNEDDDDEGFGSRSIHQKRPNQLRLSAQDGRASGPTVHLKYIFSSDQLQVFTCTAACFLILKTPDRPFQELVDVLLHQDKIVSSATAMAISSSSSTSSPSVAVDYNTHLTTTSETLVAIVGSLAQVHPTLDLYPLFRGDFGGDWGPLGYFKVLCALYRIMKANPHPSSENNHNTTTTTTSHNNHHNKSKSKSDKNNNENDEDNDAQRMRHLEVVVFEGSDFQSFGTSKLWWLQTQTQF